MRANTIRVASTIAALLSLAPACSEERGPSDRAQDAANDERPDGEVEEDAGETNSEEDASGLPPDDEEDASVDLDAALADAGADDAAADASISPEDAAADTRVPFPRDAGDYWEPPADAAPPAWPPFSAAPRSIRPWNGELTGDTWGLRARRPTFSWTAVDGATHYEVELDSDCTGAPAACAFTAPAIQVSVSEPQYTPPSDLAVSSTPPVGRRYYWRWRSCTDATCAAWAATRYVDVGRQLRDLNGDGFADVLITTGWSQGYIAPAFVFDGAAVIDTSSDLKVGPDLPPGEGTHLAYVGPAGDVNGDGFRDWYAGWFGVDSSEPYRFITHAGNDASGNATIWEYDTHAKYTRQGPLGVAGDLDADGLADVVGARSGELGEVWLGASRNAAVDVEGLTGDDQYENMQAEFTAAGLGDVDGDGYADIALLHWRGRSTSLEGGYTLMLTLSAGEPLTSTGSGKRMRRWVTGGLPMGISGPGDLDGDSLPDLLVGSSNNTLDVYLRRDADLAPHTSLPASAWDSADFNGDGRIDLALVADGRINLYYGGQELTAGPQLGSGVRKAQAAGDVNGDGYADLVAFVADDTWQLFLGGVAMDDTPDAVFSTAP